MYYHNPPRYLTLPKLILQLLSLYYHLSSASLVFFNGSNNLLKAEIQYKLFDVPYANLQQDNGYINGNVYYYTDISPCNDIFPRAPSPPPDEYYIGLSNGSLLLLDYVYNTTCTVQQIALAKQAGYDAVLFYDENDAIISITNTIQATGFPVVIIQAKVAQAIKDSIIDGRTEYTVGLFGTIMFGVITVVSSCCCLYLICTCTCCSICCCCLYSFSNREYIDTVQGNSAQGNFTTYTAQGNRNRNDLTESINRRLQQISDDAIARIPYGNRQTQSIPVTTYVKEEEDESCAICVEEFENGEQIKRLPCNHIFHVECIDQWLSRHSSLCPLCKYNLRSNRLTERAPLQSNRGNTGYGTA